MANKGAMDLLTNVLIFGGLGLGAWYGYTNNFLGIRQSLESMGGNLNIANLTGGMGFPPPPVMQTPTTGGAPFSPTGTVPNLSGFETGYGPGGGPIPGGAPGINYQNAIYDSPFGTPSIDPTTGIDYSLYYPPTGTGTLPGTNPTPYPNPCLPGHYRASDLKCYPIPTQFPGNGCGTGMYLANDGRCYPYPNGPGGGLGGGAGGGYAPTPCPVGEYRASDGRCYALPTPPPEQCPTGAYRASDGKCYPITPGQPVGDCPAGYQKGTDGVCRPTTICPAGYEYKNGVCQASTITCPAGYTANNGICVMNQTTCPAGTVLVNGVCTPAPTGTPMAIPIRRRSLIKPLPPGVSPGQFTASILKRDPFDVDVNFWAAVMLRPELSGGVPQFAVIIEAEDDSEMRDAMNRAGFIPLTPDHLMRYIPATGSFYVDNRTGTVSRYNRRILNRYR